MAPKVSIVVGCYNMPRELPRTIRSLSPAMQRHVSREDYQVIVVDNGSTSPFDEDACSTLGVNLEVLRFPPGDPSPVRALNAGLRAARGELIGVLIDGARLASPGLLQFARLADALSDRAIVVTLGFHLGPEVQKRSVRRGYDQDEEDRLLASADWTSDGYRLFGVSVFASSSARGWFEPINESNAIFMRRALWGELAGFDERFTTPGGGLVNLDLFARAVQLPDCQVVTLLGEGTFHQVHGGAQTNAIVSMKETFHSEYIQIRGARYRRQPYSSVYLGSVNSHVLPSIASSAKGLAN